MHRTPTASFPLSILLVAAFAAPARAQVNTPLALPKLVNSPGTTDAVADEDVAIAVDDSERVIAVYVATQAGTGERDIHFTKSRDQGATWSPSVPAITIFNTDGVADDREPAVTPHTNAWRLVYASDRFQANAGEHDIIWGSAGSDPTDFSFNGSVNSDSVGDTFDDREPIIASGEGVAVCVWQRQAGAGEEDLCFARTPFNSATWSSVAFLNTNATTDTGRDRHPRLATDGEGTWVCVWQSTENLGGTIGTDEDILFSRSTDAGITWSAPAALNSTATTDGGASDLSPVIAVDRVSQTWVVVWQSNNSLGGTIGTDNDLLVAKSTDGGATWSTAAVLNSDAGSDSFPLPTEDTVPDVAADRFGRFIAVWQRGTASLETDIRMARSDDFGATWSGPQAVNTNGASDVGSDTEPRVAALPLGHWVSLWNSNDALGGTIGTDLDVLGTRFQIGDPTGPGTRYCFGFSENGTRCPCGNDSSPTDQEGCLNSTGVGATCNLSGTASLAGTNHRAAGANMPPNSTALYFQGTLRENFGEGTSFGDGLRCVTGTVVRIGTVTNSAFGSSTVVLPTTGLVSGSTRCYQAWYRNAATFCTSSTFNLSSAFLTAWIP